ncbi:hypothetical protein LEN26_000892 [Aphanomyces euteiches]|nr:hypothetical protein AeMF1_010794 [Aphanomyces euteiches]KAH9162564.1 hypothetical protein LEN26_000892 [Aphanomyces euteiches]KAH9192434.1 hypothetical protein AeNC1_005588 [Aphanomyces euteiches]
MGISRWASSTVSQEPSTSQNPRRHISLHDSAQNAHYCSNHVRTFKYTPTTFLPLFLLESFRKAANCYFLVVSIMQCITSISNTNGLPATLPTLLFILLIDATFAITEDRKRHLADAVANSRTTHVLEADTFVSRQWADIRVGDYVQLFNRDMVPADLLLISVPGVDSGMAYVETKSLDGETNMKVREALEATASICATPPDLHRLRGHILAESPNSLIHSFKGVLSLETPTAPSAATDDNRERSSVTKIAIPISSILLRGSTLRNTESIYGFVLSTGPETKIMQSNKPSTSKQSRLDVCINQYILVLVLLLVACCTIAASGNLLWLNFHAGHMPYLMLPPPANPLVTWLTSFFYYVLLMYQFIPISLYVSMATVKYLQALFISWDVAMFYAPSNTPAVVRTMNLNEELGQISHIFSDKTGTLTCNMMEFRKCSIGGISYGQTKPEGMVKPTRRGLTRSDSSKISLTPKAKETASVPYTADVELLKDLQSGPQEQIERIDLFFTILAVCHTVLPESNENSMKATTPGTMRYSAASPDEQALVTAAALFGFKFIHRTQRSITVEIRGTRRTFDILAHLEFTSTRKRMSMAVREVDNDVIWLYTKGADGAVLPRVTVPITNDDVRTNEMTLAHISGFAKEGLRTLTVACKKIPTAEFTKWLETYQAALSSMDDMEKFKTATLPNAIDKCMDDLEADLRLVGATAIEDKLQDGVPDALATLIDAGIKVWMLTGDKDDTAVNIGYASNLLHIGMRLVTITAKRCATSEATVREIHDSLHNVHVAAPPLVTRQGSLRNSLRSRSRTKSHRTVSQSRISLNHRSNETLALVIDGECVHHALASCPAKFVELAQRCKVVLACRVSPAQKAALVALVKERVATSRTLAIGDGANDVPMIQEAHIGVGISGQEGLQAVNASDYAIAQFAFLTRLLLVHGRANYERLAKLVLYIIYKNILLITAQFVYTTYAGLSGQKIFLETGSQLYNVLLTSLPIIALAVWDHDVYDHVVLRLPSLYRVGPLNMHLNHAVFAYWVMCALIEAISITLVVVAAVDCCGIYGDSPGLWFLGNIVFSLVIVTANAKLLFMHHRFFIFNPIFLVGSIVLWVATAFVSSEMNMLSGINWANMLQFTVAHHIVWLAAPFVVVLVLFYTYVVRAATVMFFPTPADIVKEFVYCSRMKSKMTPPTIHKTMVDRLAKIVPRPKSPSAASCDHPNTLNLSAISQGGGSAQSLTEDLKA